MDRRIQETIDALNGDQFFINPSMRKNVSHLILDFVGTNKAGQVGTYADCGEIRMNLRDKPIHNADVNVLADKADIDAGSNKFSSTDGGAFLASVIVPMFDGDLVPNSLEVREKNALDFQYIPSASVNTVFDSLKCNVYAVYDDTPMQGIYRMLRNNKNESGQLNSAPFPLFGQNITSIYLKDNNGVISQVSLEVDGDAVLTPQPFRLLEIGTLYNNRLEVSATDRVKVQTITPGVKASAVNREAVISFSTTGDAVIEMLTCSFEFV